MAITYRRLADDGPVVREDLTREYTLVLEAITTDGESGGDCVLGSGIGFLSGHPRDLFAVCNSIEPKRHEGADDYFTITFRFTTRADILAQGDAQTVSNPDPTQRGFRFRFSTRKIREAVLYDRFYQPIRNKANDILEHEKERALLVLQVQRNIPLDQFNANWLSDYVGATNSVSYLGFDPLEVLLDDLSAEPKYEEKVPYWDVNAQLVFSRIHINQFGEERGGWVTRKLNAGFNELINGKHVPIILRGGQRPARPMLLDDDGRLLPAGTPGTPQTPIWLKFHTYEEQDLNALNLFG